MPLLPGVPRFGCFQKWIFLVGSILAACPLAGGAGDGHQLKMTRHLLDPAGWRGKEAPSLTASEDPELCILDMEGGQKFSRKPEQGQQGLHALC